MLRASIQQQGTVGAVSPGGKVPNEVVVKHIVCSAALTPPIPKTPALATVSSTTEGPTAMHATTKKNARNYEA